MQKLIQNGANLNIRTKTIKLLEKTCMNLCDLGLGNFLDMSPKRKKRQKSRQIS